VIPKDWKPCKQVSRVCFVQDPIHLDINIAYSISNGKLFSHNFPPVHLVQPSFSEEEHSLWLKDLEHQNRQNFEAVNTNLLALLDKMEKVLNAISKLQFVI